MIDHEGVKAELEALKQKGVIAPHAVVDAAKDPDSALHSCFTWDDSEAAHKYRLEEARRLLRVYVVEVQSGGKVVPARAYVSLSSDRKSGGGYRAIVDVLSDADLKSQLLQDAFREFETFRQKYESVQELEPVFEAAKKVERKHREEAPQLAA